MAEFAYLDNGGLPIASAHRGGAAEAERAGMLENSMPAYRRVADLGYRYIELDVRATSDGEVYTWHGQGAERADKRRPLKKADIEAIRVNGERAIPRLDEVLEELPDMRFQIDPKHWPAVEPLAETIIASLAFDRVSVGAFSQRRTEQVAQIIVERSGIEICTGMGVKGVAQTMAHAHLLSQGSWQALSPLANLPRSASTPAMIRAAHEGGAQVVTWTVNEETEMQHFLDIGVDGIYTDEPTLLKDVLQRRGLWAQ
jgi:glycerophosphoryl diester phosphodiesterase